MHVSLSMKSVLARLFCLVGFSNVQLLRCGGTAYIILTYIPSNTFGCLANQGAGVRYVCDSGDFRESLEGFTKEL